MSADEHLSPEQLQLFATRKYEEKPERINPNEAFLGPEHYGDVWLMSLPKAPPSKWDHIPRPDDYSRPGTIIDDD